MTVRPIRPFDDDAINALHRSVWWPERSAAGWRWLDANPARLEIGAPAGWVVEDAQGRPGAFAGNLIQRFWSGDTSHHGATGFSIIVPPQMRGRSRDLLRAFTRQPNVFAHYTFNANARSAGLYHRYGLKPWPPRTHALKLSWTIDPWVCAQGRGWREVARRMPARIDASRERMMNPRLRRTPDLALPAGVSPLLDFSDASSYAAFWKALRQEGRLIADRSPAILRWRLSDPDLTRAPLILSYEVDEEIVGYAMAIVAKGNPIEPPCLEILDLVALEDEPRAIPTLMRALMANARRLGAAKVRMQTVNDEMLRRLGPYAACARREGGWGHCHAAFAEDAPPIDSWAPTPFDGDYGICLRPAPIDAAAAQTRQETHCSAA